MGAGRRPLFFFFLGLICLLLTPVTPGEFRWVNYSMFGLAVFWTIALGLEEVGNLHEGEGRNRDGG
jgi:intracellular septation protein A